MRHVRVQIENANFTYAATWLVTAKFCSSTATTLPSMCSLLLPGNGLCSLLWVWPAPCCGSVEDILGWE